jgi:hypothetical protein
MVAIGVDSTTTVAGAGLDFGRNTREAKPAEEGEAVDVGGEAVGAVLSRHAV